MLPILLAFFTYKSAAGRYRPVIYPDGPITTRYRFIKNASWVLNDIYLHTILNIYFLSQVDSGEKLTSLLPSDGTDKTRDDDWSTGSECMVVKRPQILSKEEDLVVTYHDTIDYCKIYPIPLIEIPE